MGIHLVGGGTDLAHAGEVWGRFVAEAGAHAAADGGVVPVIAVLLVGDADDLARRGEYFRSALAAAGPCAVRVQTAPLDGAFGPLDLAGAHAVVIGGGLTPAYRSAVEPIAGELRRLTAAGTPYAGFSAGAAIAADQALLGGWRIGDVPVCPEEAGEDLDQVSVEAGLGLLDVTVDVHAAQWGTLARLIAATEAGLVDGGLAIDEHTSLVIGDGGLAVTGVGNVWNVRRDGASVVVGTIAR